ncbi:MAG TPA: glycosyltransferase family 4 protein [Candidatus Limnocylindrales bacterium]|nr:glycosyltransferase family 4 protein [Candidatus Limnocylindrales bacterium]
MRIAQLAPTFERVPPRAYGGTELIVHEVTEALVARGHDVTLFASGDSLTAAALRSVTPIPRRYGERSDDGLVHAEYVQLANAQAAFLAAADGEFDLVHNHAGIEGMVLAAMTRTPVISTMHNPFVEATRPVWDAYPWFHHAVSRASAATFPERGALPPIHHGIDVASYRFADHPPDGPLLFLGRFSPAKGADRAIDAALAAGRRLILAGKIDAADKAHVAARIRPRIDGERVVYVGEADGEMKRNLLAEASALLFPIDWDEPFGLVMVEALSAGTPVIGFRRASVPEVIDDGRTGFVVDDVEGMVEAIGRLGSIDRRVCRAEAERRFSVERMVDDVEAMYRSVIEGVTAGSAAS